MAIRASAMEPVLAHQQPRLTPDAHALLTALVAGINPPGALSPLDAFPPWREATPLPPD